MKTFFRLCFFSFLSVCVPSLSSAQKSGTHIPDYPIRQGVSAPFAGFVDSVLIVAGGCNFPDKPAAEGGKKVYYSQIYSLTPGNTSKQWQEQTPLPIPVAYGASIETKDGLVCIGGMNNDSTSTAVFRIEISHSNPETVLISNLPSLSVGIDNAAAARIGNILYITGGNQPQQKKALYMLSMEQPESWKKLPDYPGKQRVQPTLVGTDNFLYLAGGFAFDSTTKTCTLSTDILRYDPSTEEWKIETSIPPYPDNTPRCLVGSSGIAYDDYLIFTGGVYAPLFKEAMEGKQDDQYLKHEPTWYQFHDDLLIYHTTDKSWKIIPHVAGMAKAGGVLLRKGNTLYMICGEIKPGIRTAEIPVISLSDLLK